jgi:hypothetical protein
MKSIRIFAALISLICECALSAPAQIIGLVPATDTVTVLSIGDIGPSMSYSLGTSPQGTDSIQFVAHDALYAGSPGPSHLIPRLSFLVSNPSAAYSYELWYVAESNDPPIRTQIIPDRGTHVYNGHGYLMLCVLDSNLRVDSLKVQTVVLWTDAINLGLDGLANSSTLQLMQNFPNPFNGQTTFQFYLPTEGDANLNVYDLLGRLVRSMTLGSRPAGTHTIHFQADELPSGAYVVTLRIATHVAVCTMVLLR